jgi:hypothetical protein
MRKPGVEPGSPSGHQILSLARLPVPPLSRLFSLPRHTVRRDERAMVGGRGTAPHCRTLAPLHHYHAVLRFCFGRIPSIFGRTFARLAARTLLMINSLTGPLDEAIELIALLAGTGLT